MDQPQIGQRVLDLFALIEPGAADQAIRHPARHERVFQRAGLRIGAIHHRAIAQLRIAARDQALDRADHKRRLVSLVIRLVDRDFQPSAAVSAQRLRRAMGVADDDRIGDVEDRLRGAIVLFEQDNAGAWEILAEALDVAIIRAAQAIDRLVLVTDREDVAALVSQ